MADKRIYELTDSQESYDPDIYVQTDDATFSNTKKMPIDSIYPKIDTLDAVGDFNPVTSTLRIGSGSNVEKKATVTDFFDDTDVEDIITSKIGIKLKAGGSVLGSTGVVTQLRGDLTVTGIKNSTGTYTITHNLGTADYMLNITTRTLGSMIYGTIKSANYFQVVTFDFAGLSNENFDFDLFEYTI